jgi:excisionase family DNA binding protein
MATATETTEPRLMTIREAAAQLGTSVFTLRRLVRDERLPVVRFSPRGWLRFRPEDIESLAQSTVDERIAGGELLTVGSSAALLGVTPADVVRLIQDGTLELVDERGPKGQLLLRRDDLLVQS